MEESKVSRSPVRRRRTVVGHHQRRRRLCQRASCASLRRRRWRISARRRRSVRHRATASSQWIRSLCAAWRGRTAAAHRHRTYIVARWKFTDEATSYEVHENVFDISIIINTELHLCSTVNYQLTSSKVLVIIMPLSAASSTHAVSRPLLKYHWNIAPKCLLLLII